MKTALLATALLALLTAARADIITRWDFNNTNAPLDSPPPALGTGTAALLGAVSAAYIVGASGDSAGTNKAWNTRSYPAATLGNKSAGVQFLVPTTGYENISLGWAQHNSTTASRHLRLQYTLDGSTYTDADVIALYMNSSSFTNQTVNLSAIAGAANNPLFGFRLVSEFESTATGTGTNAYVATSSGSATNYSTAGTIGFDLVTVSGTPIFDGNTPPYIFPAIADQSLRPGDSTAPLPFTVLDAEDPALSLALSADSSNPLVVPLGNIIFGGSGANRTVTAAAGSQSGSSRITLYVFDTGGKSNSLSFTVTVLPANDPPLISPIPHTNTLENVPTPPIAFTIGDRETPAAGLTVSGVSANPALVPNSPANLSFDGSGTNRTLTLTPAPGRLGVAPITVTVSDGANTASSIFTLMVRPSTNVIFIEPFDYPNGSLVTNSGFLWDNRSGTDGQCQATNGQLQITADQSEDPIAPLIGAPYAKGAGTVLYAGFKARFLTLPPAKPGSFAHFASGSYLRARLYAGTSNAAPNCFRLAVANQADADAVQLPIDLPTNTTCTIVTRYDLDAATTTLWVNPAAESDPGISATDPQTPVTLSSYAFRQAADIGATMLLDDLRVGLSFAAVTSQPGPNFGPLAIERSGGNVILRWTNADGLLQSAPAVDGVYSDLPGAASPFTNLVTGPARFFRLRPN